ncbi:hypothetical protein [Citrobacter portucalensis]|nr:hypothetical protein [Citrobacter portucalensis]MEB1055682.1 hypothetical protein [Citrobacter portucalensis]
MPRLHLLTTEQGFAVPYGSEAFSELLGLRTLWHITLQAWCTLTKASM